MKTKAAQPTKLIKKEQKDFFPNMRSIINKSGFVERTLAALKGDEKEYCAICGKIVEEDDQDYQIIQKRSGDLIVHNDCKNSQEYEELSMFGLNDAD